MITLQLVSGPNSYQNIISSNLIGGGVDYNSGPYSVTFPAGVTSISLNVKINNDNILEGNETFILTIANSFLSNQGFIFTVGAYDKATVTIIDTTSKRYIFTFHEY